MDAHRFYVDLMDAGRELTFRWQSDARDATDAGDRAEDCWRLAYGALALAAGRALSDPDDALTAQEEIQPGDAKGGGVSLWAVGTGASHLLDPSGGGPLPDIGDEAANLIAEALLATDPLFTSGGEAGEALWLNVSTVSQEASMALRPVVGLSGNTRRDRRCSPETTRAAMAIGLWRLAACHIGHSGQAPKLLLSTHFEAAPSMTLGATQRRGMTQRAPGPLRQASALVGMMGGADLALALTARANAAEALA